MRILGLIPARGGSKSIPRKNIAPLGGKPLIAWTCEAARQSQRLSRIVVSTDDDEIAAVAAAHGIEAPFRRPAELSGDTASSIDVALHALRWLSVNEDWRPDVLVLLQPTSPFRAAAHIDGALDLLLSSRADTVVSVMPVPHRFSPYSIMQERAGRLDFLLHPPFDRFRRQEHPKLFSRNGPAVLALRAPFATFWGGHTVGYEMDERSSIDIDDAADLARAEAML